MTQCTRCYSNDQSNGHEQAVCGTEMELVHTGAANTAVLAAALHCCSQFVSTPKRRDKQGNQQGDQCFCFLN